MVEGLNDGIEEYKGLSGLKAGFDCDGADVTCP